MVVGHHRRIAAGEVRHGHTDNGVFNGIDVRGARFANRFGPHVETNVVCFHRVVGHRHIVAGVLNPGIDKVVVVIVIDAHEVVPCRQVAHQRPGIDTGKLLLTYREGDDRNIGSVDALVGKLGVKRYVGVAVHCRDHRSRLALFTETANFGHDVLPIGMTERRVVDHDVLIRDAVFILEERFEDTVGGARVDIVGTDQRKALNTHFIDQILNRRNRLLVRCRAGVKDVF